MRLHNPERTPEEWEAELAGCQENLDQQMQRNFRDRQHLRDFNKSLDAERKAHATLQKKYAGTVEELDRAYTDNGSLLLYYEDELMRSIHHSERNYFTVRQAHQQLRTLHGEAARFAPPDQFDLFERWGRRFDDELERLSSVEIYQRGTWEE